MMGVTVSPITSVRSVMCTIRLLRAGSLRTIRFVLQGRIRQLPVLFFFLMIRRPPSPTLFPYTTLFRSHPGAEASVTIAVTPDMLATFEERGPVPPLYSTWSMVRQMELACRKIILPYLEADEDAVGYSVDVTHLASTGVGDRVTARARLVQIEGRRIVCAVEAHNSQEKIGVGTRCRC